eukprot:scaffold65283_cov18-Tisochrysis_lutea.AAC.1
MAAELGIPLPLMHAGSSFAAYAASVTFPCIGCRRCPWSYGTRECFCSLNKMAAYAVSKELGSTPFLLQPVFGQQQQQGQEYERQGREQQGQEQGPPPLQGDALRDMGFLCFANVTPPGPQ